MLAAAEKEDTSKMIWSIKAEWRLIFQWRNIQEERGFQIGLTSISLVEVF